MELVYTWLDPTCPEFHADLRRYSSRPEHINPERYRDCFEILKYSLRSVESYAPWLATVHLFTRRPHVPAWLDRAHPDVRIHHHDEVIPEEYLPTFNTRCIESYLSRLPGSSDHLLYLNDDYLFASPVSREDFLGPADRLRIYGTVFGEHFQRSIYGEHGLPYSLHFVEHIPRLIHRPSYEAMLASRPDELHRTRSNRFRDARDLKMNRWYNYFLLSEKNFPVEAVPVWQAMRLSLFHPITGDLGAQRRGLAALRRRRPRFVCLNDDLGPVPDPRVVQEVLALLEEFYPRPSRFER
ncbi:MAG: hypothetical protein AB1758_37265 [Candidatus Eremiobacterota bacterium]